MSNSSRLSAAPYGIYITAKDIGLETWWQCDFITLAADAHLPSVIHTLARFNVALEAGGMEDRNLQIDLAKYLLAPKTFRRVGELMKARGRVLWICPLQLRLVISYLICHGSAQGQRTTDDREFRHRLGLALLSSPDALSITPSQIQSYNSPAALSIALQLIHCGYRSDQRGLEQISVKGYILDKLLARTGVAHLIESDLGFTSVEFQTAMLALWLHFFRHTSAHLLNTSSSSIGFEYFMGQAKIPQVVGDEIRRRFCVELDHPNSRSSGMNGIALLAEKPFAIHDDKMICLDLDFALAKAGKELWNIATSLAKTHKVSSFSAEAGYVFEEYCGEILGKIQQARAEHGAKLLTSSEIAKAPVDFLYIEGEYALVVECKTAPLPTSILYGTDPSKLGEGLKSKFVSGSTGDRQGFIQCANHIRTMLKNPEKYGLHGVKCIVPCLIVMEDAITTYPLFDYVVDEAKPLFTDLNAIVKSPTIIHAEDLGILAMRAKIVNPAEALLTMGASGLSSSGFTKNFILKSWPEALVSKELEVEINRPTHFFDAAIDYLGRGYSPPPSKKCPRCGDEMITVSRRTESAWWCTECCSETLDFSEGDAIAMAEHKGRIISWYRSSRTG